jgi:RHS repeat-associated protein
MLTYDGDGVRTNTLITPYDENGLPQTPQLTSYFFGGSYEVTGGAVKKYYSFAGQTILRDANGLQYFLTDHLGSVLATLAPHCVRCSAGVTNDVGTLTSQQRYLPFGGERTDVGTIVQTDFGYTGQRLLDEGMGGLMDYKARFYSPALGRFIQPDTIVPEPTKPQSFNRYSYTLNNPLRYIDLTGHDPSPWDPFDYDTLIISLDVNLELPLGINPQAEWVLDIKSLKEYQFDLTKPRPPHFDWAITVSNTFTAGAQLDADFMGTIGGTNDSVKDIMNDNVSSSLETGTIPAHFIVCGPPDFFVCAGASYDFDPSDPDWRNNNSSVSYSGGIGQGGSIGVDVATVRDWVFACERGKGFQGVRVQVPNVSRMKMNFIEAVEDTILIGWK